MLIPHFKPLPPLKEILDEFPLLPRERLFIEESRHQIQKALFGNPSGEKERFLLIVGPCSIHDTSGAREYARKLKALSQGISPPFLTVMRFFFEKPRTTLGWKGLVHDPYLTGSSNVIAGIKETRKLLLECAKMQLPVGSEFLDPLIYPYFADLVSWGCIGARTAESPVHRQLASLLPMPVGFKNPTSGNLETAVQSVLVARHSHTFLGQHPTGCLSLITSPGNLFSHIVLRGGDLGPNFEEASVKKSLHLLRQYGLPPRLLIDCAHGNSLKNHHRQKDIFLSVFERWRQKETGIRGALVESYLKEGNQAFSTKRNAPDLSITDPCLSWEDTEDLLSACFEISRKEPQSCVHSCEL